jgi:hypothetical protein
LFGWLSRLLTRLLSPDILKREILRAPAKRPELAVVPAAPHPQPKHKDPRSDTAVIMLESVRKEANKAMEEAKDVCEMARKTTSFRR